MGRSAYYNIHTLAEDATYSPPLRLPLQEPTRQPQQPTPHSQTLDAPRDTPPMSNISVDKGQVKSGRGKMEGRRKRARGLSIIIPPLPTSSFLTRGTVPSVPSQNGRCGYLPVQTQGDGLRLRSPGNVTEKWWRSRGGSWGEVESGSTASDSATTRGGGDRKRAVFGLVFFFGVVALVGLTFMSLCRSSPVTSTSSSPRALHVRFGGLTIRSSVI